MFEGHHPLSIARNRSSWIILSVALMIAVVGCGTVAVTVEEPAGTKVELYEKAKWFGGCGPDWARPWGLHLGCISSLESKWLRPDVSHSGASAEIARAHSVNPSEHRT